jgi:carboxyl-terminal processing protease
VLKQAFQDLTQEYFQPLASADMYEVGLRAIEIGLKQSGIDPQAKVQIPQFGDQDDANWNLFLQAYSLVLAKYQGKVTEDQLENFALSGATSSLQDCETSYYPASIAENYFNQRTGQASIVGIGINLQSGTTSNGNVHLIARTIAGSPAEKAGLQMGDQILAIDGQDLSTKTSQEVIQLLQGTRQAGSKVSLTIHRANSASTQTIDVTRDSFQVPPMEHGTINNNIGYIRFNQFPLLTQSQMTTVTGTISSWLSDFDKAGVTGYVLDLRGNSYGSIGLVQNVLSYFMSGDNLVYLNGNRQDQNNQHVYGVFPMPSVQNVKATDKPVSVVVDGGTSGEAEIMAYAIQQAKRGTIVGDATAGCVQSSSPSILDDNSLLNLTNYRAISDPNKPESIVTGVEPDQPGGLDLQQLSQGKDSQLDAAVKALTK